MASNVLESVIVKLADGSEESLLKMPPYVKHRPECLSCEEDILVAENKGVTYGAVSVSHKDILYVPGVWRNAFAQRLNDVTRTISGGWVSKLYVLPEYRYHGVGTRLVEEAVKRLGERGFTEAYVGIYVKNDFRAVSKDIFRNLGFKGLGSCICLLKEGYCRGVLLKKTMFSTKQL
jgi:GNAT superfamily N-acetyltransferase